MAASIRLMTEKDFRTYFRDLYPQLARYAARLLGDSDVDDVLQGSFLELWNRRTDILEPAHVKSFVYRSVYTHALNVIKHRQVVRKYSDAVIEMENRRLDSLDPNNSEVLQKLRNDELQQRINLAINELPPKSRQVFVMSYLHGLKNKEIAEVMNVSVRTVDAHIYNALRQLRSKLDKNSILGLLMGIMLVLCDGLLLWL
ncbi:RNA polymerase sigma-70 factor [Prevotella sp. oral taxon 475]|uniref:RNA polymerase sigma-70 factor n=1 Tax=Prevotella sp. oral taxon 475 TaxID=712471 RepID=UPI0020120F84|nr:RNA polymerase sigma-70 factor [Prevotella sp. oral taxon 475]